MGAYESLWSAVRQSFKTIADLFRGRDVLPSDLVLPAIAEQFARQTTEILRRANVERFGIRLHGTVDYPSRLRDAKNPVELLYFQGWWDLLDTKCVAVVGTREPSENGMRKTSELVRGLVGDGFSIVSGLAAGIDTAAHQSAIDAGGKTIAVLGTPISRSYPSGNADLQKMIADDHLVVSQVPVVRYAHQDWRQNRIFFPQRNVTMSALSSATVIVEASDTSGTLMQAKAAIDQNRKLFILDSCFDDPNLKWPWHYQGMGAIRVKGYEDVRRHLTDAAAKA